MRTKSISEGAIHRYHNALIDIFNRSGGMYKKWCVIKASEFRKKHQVSGRIIHAMIGIGIIEQSISNRKVFRWNAPDPPSEAMAVLLLKYANCIKNGPRVKDEYTGEERHIEPKAYGLELIPADDLIKELVRRKYTGNLYPPVEPIIL